MEIKRKCENCKSEKLEYKEEMTVRHWTWWQWVIGWVCAIAFFPLGAAFVGIPLIIYLIYCMVKKKQMILSYTCQECGFTKKL